MVAQLLDYYYADCGDIFEAMIRMLHAVDGAYALGIICADYPDRLLCARKDAPLLLGFGEGENMIASDVTAIIRHTRDIAYLDDGELAILSAKGIRVYDSQMRPIEKEHRHVDWDVAAAEKGGYEHFMLKEIHEQPACHPRRPLPPASEVVSVVLRDLNMTDQQIRDINKICHCGLRIVVPRGDGGQVQSGADAAAPAWRCVSPPSSGTAIPSWARAIWSSSSASPARRWTPWRPCGRPSAGAPAC